VGRREREGRPESLDLRCGAETLVGRFCSLQECQRRRLRGAGAHQLGESGEVASRTGASPSGSRLPPPGSYWLENLAGAMV